MPNRITPQMAFDVVSATATWVRHYQRSLELSDFTQLYDLQDEQLNSTNGKFWPTLRSLHDKMFDDFPACAWWVAAIRLRRATSRPQDSRDPFAFYPQGRQDVANSPTWELSGIMSALSKNCSTAPFETLLTSDLCLNVLHDFTPFVIDRKPWRDENNQLPDHWHLYVGDLANEIDERMGALRILLLDLLAADHALQEITLREIDNSLKTICTGMLHNKLHLAGPDGKSTEYDKLHKRIFMDGSHRLLPLAKYVTIMSAIWPRWQRIWMVPHPSPTSDYVQPGGILICEDDQRGDPIATNEVRDLSNISAAAMWPWLGVSLNDAASADANYETPFERLRTIRNVFVQDSQRWEYDQRALIDNGTFKCTPAVMNSLRTRVRNCDKSISIVVPAKGNRREFLKCLESIARQNFLTFRPGNVELIVIQDGPDKDPCNDPICPEAWQVVSYLKKHGGSCHFFGFKTHSGRSSARNVGLYHATKDIIFFIDSSMILSNDFITEHMMRHILLERVALLGFKEKINWDNFESLETNICAGDKKPNFQEDWKYTHSLKKGEEFVDQRHVRRKEGDTVNYMHELDWLMNLPALEGVGARSLPSFFQTNLVSVNTELAKNTGGFLKELDGNWGLEDTFMGAILMANGVRLIPCPSSTAFMLYHSEPQDKSDQMAANRKIMNAYMHKSMMQFYTKARLETVYYSNEHMVHEIDEKLNWREVRRRT